ncbi:hypothetical protein [Methylibium sp.]|uniref:hypothetical protein n=1 Tax=Methylibium sp. TaxID=2067992 RepID=UPI003D0BE51A
MSTDGLPARMLARADADGLPADHPLRTTAAAFAAAIEGFYATVQTVPVSRFMGAWARARRAWCEYTGEALL